MLWAKVDAQDTHRQPGLCNILVTCFIVSANFGAGVMSILVQLVTNTFSHSNGPLRCSLLLYKPRQEHQVPKQLPSALWTSQLIRRWRQLLEGHRTGPRR